MSETTSRARSSARSPGFLLACAVACASAAGCVPSLGQNPPRDANVTLPAEWGAGPDGTVPATLGLASSGKVEWDRFFTDPDLRALVEAALANNQELNIALQEIIVAQSEVMARRGEYLPRLEARIGAGIEKVGEHTSQGVSDEVNDVDEHLQDYAFGFVASWEVDVWKKLRNAAAAANYRYLSSIEGRHFMVTQVVAEIATAYYELMALDNQVEVLRRNIDIQKDALNVVRLQKDAAQVTLLAVQRFEAEVLKNQSRLFDLEQQRIETENRINFLVGRYPQSVRRNSRTFRSPLPNVVEAGIPAQLLENRPDLKQAEQQLVAAKLDVAAARASFYPRLSLEGAVGYESFDIGKLVMTPESLAYTVAANIAAPLLNRKAIQAEYYAANAEQIRAAYNYERAALRGFTEVVNLLAMLKNLHQGYELQARQVDLLEEAIDSSGVLFQSARADYMEVLLTRRDALEAEMELIETRNRQLRATVDLYQALGGGWRQEEPAPVAQVDPAPVAAALREATVAAAKTEAAPVSAAQVEPVAVAAVPVEAGADANVVANP